MSSKLILIILRHTVSKFARFFLRYSVDMFQMVSNGSLIVEMIFSATFGTR